MSEILPPLTIKAYVLMQVHFSRRTNQGYVIKLGEYSTLADAMEDAKNLGRWVVLKQKIVARSS